MSENKLNPIISQQFPEFVRDDHATLVAFMEAYYEWLENEYSDLSPTEIADAYDIDETVDVFIESFRNQYLKNFPLNLATRPDGTSVSKETLIKNIRDFYQSKGTEASYKFLFQLIFGVDVETYLPKSDIFVASGSKYITQTSVKLTNALGEDIFKAVGKIITQINPTDATVTARARCERVITYREGDFDVAELYIVNIQGAFETGLPVEFTADEVTYRETYTYPMITSIQIDNAGTGYQIGDNVTILSTFGSGASAEVSRVGNVGEIKSIRMIDFGVNYSTGITVAISREDTTDSSYVQATGTAVVGPVARHAGFYDTEVGHLDTNKVLQDNVYYQAYSYVLKSEIVISRYKEFVKNLVHPAGFSFFGAVHILRCFEEFIATENLVNTIHLPRIGNYMPYTFEEDKNLHNDYPSGYTSPIFGGIIRSLGNPLGDPFWPIFMHPDERTEFGDIKIGEFINQDGGYTHECSNIPSESSLEIG